MRVVPGVDPFPPPPPGVLAAVAECPDRGPSLPVSLQPACWCAELYECKAGRGAVPGRVTTADCVRCKSAAPGVAPP